MADTGMVTFEIEDRELKRMLDAGVREYRLAASASLNKAMARIRTYSVRVLSKQSKIPQKNLRKRVRVFRANPGRLYTSGRFHILPMLAKHLKYRANSSGVTVAGQNFPRAFIMPDNDAGAPGGPWQRKGRSRTPIERIKVPLGNAESVIDHGTARYTGLLVNKYLPGEIMWRLNRAAGKVR